MQRWWERLLTHEVEFHLGEHPEHTGPRHDADAAPIAAEWFARPVTARRPSAGLRKPHGSELDAWFTGSLLTGDEMTMDARRELADRLERRLNRTRPPASAAEQAGLLREMVGATLRLLRGEPLGERWREVAPTRLHWLADMASGRLVDTILGSAADAGHAERGGVREVFARDEVGLLHEVVTAALAPAAGFAPAQAHVLAVLAERLVDGPDHRGERWRTRPGWLTARAQAELSELAVRNPAARVLLVWGYEQVRAEISSRFAELPEWRELVLRYAAEFHAAAIEEARLPELSEPDLRSEYDKALTGLQQLVAGDKSLSWRQRRSLSQALRKAEREAGGPRRWEIEVDLRSLRVITERAGVWPTDPELVYLAVRNVTWGRHTDSLQLARVRWLATTVLMGTASPELSMLLRPERQYGGSTRLVRVEVPVDLRLPARALPPVTEPSTPSSGAPADDGQARRPDPTTNRSGAIAVTLHDAEPTALDERELVAAERAVRELHHERPGAPLGPGDRDYRRADPRGRWAAHGVRVYVLPGLRRRFDQLIRAPGARELALLYFVTRGPGRGSRRVRRPGHPGRRAPVVPCGPYVDRRT